MNSSRFGLPFVYGDTKDRLNIIEKNLVTVVSRVDVRRINIDPTSGAELVYFGDGSLSLVDAPLEPDRERVPTWITATELAIAIFLAVSIIYKISRVIWVRRVRQS